MKNLIYFLSALLIAISIPISSFSQCGTSVSGYQVCITISTSDNQNSTCSNHEVDVSATLYHNGTVVTSGVTGAWSLDGNYAIYNCFNGCYPNDSKTEYTTVFSTNPNSSAGNNYYANYYSTHAVPIPTINGYGPHCISYTMTIGSTTTTISSGIFYIPQNSSMLQLNNTNSTATSLYLYNGGSTIFAGSSAEASYQNDNIAVYPVQNNDAVIGTFVPLYVSTGNAYLYPPTNQVMAYQTVNLGYYTSATSITVTNDAIMEPVIVQNNSVLYAYAGNGTSPGSICYSWYNGNMSPQFQVQKGGRFKAVPKSVCSATYSTPSGLCNETNNINTGGGGSNPGDPGGTGGTPDYGRQAATIDSVKTIAPALGLYPNPTTGIVNIALASTIEQNVTIVIHDALGQEVYNNSASLIGTKVLEADLSAEPSGLYVVQVTSGSTVTTQKIVLAK